MRRTTVNGFTVEFSYRDIDADLHDLDRRAIAKAIQLGFYSGWLSDAYQSPGSWCVVR
jgi:hypothetical protein